MKLTLVSLGILFFGLSCAGIRSVYFTPNRTQEVDAGKSGSNSGETLPDGVVTSRIGREGGPQPHFDSGSLSTLPLKLPKMEIRKFTLQANSGEPAKTVEAEVVGFAGQLVRLQKGDGRVAGVEISTLSSEDQSWIEQHFGAYRRILSGL